MPHSGNCCAVLSGDSTGDSLCLAGTDGSGRSEEVPLHACRTLHVLLVRHGLFDVVGASFRDESEFPDIVRNATTAGPREIRPGELWVSCLEQL